MGDWLTILIILLILGILLDGWRRMHNARKDSLKVSPSVRRSAGSSKAAADDYSAELPNGGARVVAYRETPEDERPFHHAPVDEVDDDRDLDGQDFDDRAFDDREALQEEDGELAEDDETNLDEQLAELDSEAAEAETRPPATSKLTSERQRPETHRGIPEQVTLNLDESVPILMETTGEDTFEDDPERIEPTLGGNADSSVSSARAAKPEPSSPARSEAKKPEAPVAKSPKPAPAKPEPRKAEKAPSDRRTAKPEEPPKAPPQPEEVLIVNVMAPTGEQFRGDALLDSLVSAGLRFGDMNIFHRYEGAKGGGPILFSLANMVKPGVFDLDTMADFTTPGVSLFMTLPLEERVELDNVEVFDEMLEAARAIALELGGELKDENRSVMTRQTQEHCRQRIHEFERKQLSRMPH
ncbi:MULTISPECIES: cell division protein ZipA [Marinimicrobium]|uniref:Cell division protein ZipA n=1 Tax=Marinimicrobium koreense TaxID=306545 RepID=A0A3N1P5M8_9GAMM|nr:MULTISPECIES: cell division protein ZipA [Marinimicrobium]ROQ20126.1 cell division protein ZipA [Marinimicrobium koreense]